MIIYITTFYNVRNLRPWEIPVSTAAWDPRWFHEGKSIDHVFRDKRGIINGLRIEELNPIRCHASGCPCSVKDPSKCDFIRSYKDGLNKIDFDQLMDKLKSIADKWYLGDYPNEGKSADIVLLVYEAKSNPCSERKSIVDYFAEHGVEVNEWSKDK